MEHTVSFYVFASLLFPPEHLHPLTSDPGSSDFIQRGISGGCGPGSSSISGSGGHATVTSAGTRATPALSRRRARPQIRSASATPASSIAITFSTCKLHCRRALHRRARPWIWRAPSPTSSTAAALHRRAPSPARWTSTAAALSSGELPPLRSGHPPASKDGNG